MKICVKCQTKHNKQGLYCSRKCANSRNWSEADKKKKSESAKKSIKVKEARKKITAESYEKMKLTKQKKYKKLIFSLSYDDLNYSQLRKRIYYEQDGKCNKCKLDKWMGNDIPLELEHKDGNNINNKRKNLEFICPNCHALTPTWRGRNYKKNEKVTDETLFIAIIENNFNFRQALLQVGLVAKGGNYNRCHKLKRDYDKLNK